MKLFRRQLHSECKVLDEAEGLVRYIASDETIDSDQEIIRAAGWKFNRFSKNAPFVDSHRYDTIERQLGKVVEYTVEKGKLIETVQWAKTAHRLAEIGWNLTVGGFLKSVSVGFRPLKILWRGDADNMRAWRAQLRQLGLDDDAPVSRIFLQQEQLELSAVIIPANPNAVMIERTAKAYKGGCLGDSDIDFLMQEYAKQQQQWASRSAAPDRAAEADLGRACERFARGFETLVSKL